MKKLFYYGFALLMGNAFANCSSDDGYINTVHIGSFSKHKEMYSENDIKDSVNLSSQGSIIFPVSDLVFYVV